MDVNITSSDSENSTLGFWSTPLPQNVNPVLVYIASLSSTHSRRMMHKHLNSIARLLTNDDKVIAEQLDWSKLRYQHSQAIRSILMEMYSFSTVNAMLSALRGVLKEAWRLGYVDAETYYRAIDIPNVKGKRLPTGRHIAFGEIQALSDVCFEDASDAGARDSAIIGLLATCGLRRSEIPNLFLEHFDGETGQVKVVGKGNKERTAWLRGGAFLAMQDWLSVRDVDLKVMAIFVPINKGGNQQDRVLSEQAVYDVVKKRSKEAQIKACSPHDFRRTMISDLLAKGVDVLLVQKMVGHEDPATTSHYDLRDEQFKAEAAEKLHYPHRPRRQQTLL